MRILLDENLPESVRHALRLLGHEVDSVGSLRMKGIDNGRLYREVAVSYDLCFTKDRGFAGLVRASAGAGAVKIVRVTIPQATGREFAETFIEAFGRTDWSVVSNADDWP